MNTEPKKAHFLHNKIIFMHCSLQIKQRINSIGIFSAPVVTQFKTKNRKKTMF